ASANPAPAAPICFNARRLDTRFDMARMVPHRAVGADGDVIDSAYGGVRHPFDGGLAAARAHSRRDHVGRSSPAVFTREVFAAIHGAAEEDGHVWPRWLAAIHVSRSHNRQPFVVRAAC